MLSFYIPGTLTVYLMAFRFDEYRSSGCTVSTDDSETRFVFKPDDSENHTILSGPSILHKNIYYH